MQKYKPKIAPTSRILIVLHGSIGDVVRALPVASAIKQYSKNIKLTWIVEPKSADLVRLSHNVDKVIVFERRQGIFGFLKAVNELRKEKYDIVFDMQRHFKSALVSLLSGGKFRLGFHRRNSKEFNWLFLNDTIIESDEKKAKILQYFDFLKFFELPISETFDFGLKVPELKPEIGQLFAKQSIPLIGFVLGSSWPSKDWAQQGYEKLANIIHKDNFGTIVLLGDKNQLAISSKLEKSVSRERIINLVGKTSLLDLIAVIPKLTAIVGPDSGPGHIAASFGVPHVTLIGPTDSQRVAPIGMESLVVRSSVPCSPCLRKVCPGLGNVCMKLISPEAVFGTLKKSVL